MSKFKCGVDMSLYMPMFLPLIHTVKKFKFQFVEYEDKNIICTKIMDIIENCKNYTLYRLHKSST